VTSLQLDEEFVRRALGDPARVAALARTGLLETGPDEAFDRLTRLASAIVGTPVAFVSLLDDQLQHFKSVCGPGNPANPGSVPLDGSFCKFTVASRQPFVIEDAREHPLVRDYPIVSEGRAVAYAGIPLVTSEGHAIGTFCVGDEKPRHWNTEELSALAELARSAMNEIELRSLTRQLAEQNERLWRLDREKNELVTVISHELRAPLTSVLGALELLQADEGALGPEQATLVRMVDRNARRVLRLVEDLLATARAELGGLEIAHAPVELSELVGDSVEAIRPRAAAAQIRLEVACLDTVTVDGDPQRLGQVIDNLLGNAIKFTPAHGSVSVSLERRGGAVRLSVSDTGIGIPQHEQARVFERFYRAQGAREEGTGLGLAIVKALVEAHGGTISLESEPGVGSTFVVELPASDTLASAA
jgi:signal transduction histidine kinase